MKLINQILSFILLAVLSGALFSNCGQKGGTLSSITVTPADKIIAPGTTLQFAASAGFTDGTSVNWTSAAVWDSSDPAAVTVGTTLGSFGLASASTNTNSIGSGKTVTITARDVANNIAGTTTLSVAVPDTITVSPTPVRPYLNPGITQQLAAVALLSVGTKTDTQDLTTHATWTADTDPSIAAVSSAGLVTTGTATGVVRVTATDLFSGVTGSIDFDVASSSLLSQITVTTDKAVVSAATPTAQFSAEAVFNDRPPSHRFTKFWLWSTSDPSQATIGSTGLLTAGTVTGPVVITVTASDPLSGMTGTTSITVE